MFTGKIGWLRKHCAAERHMHAVTTNCLNALDRSIATDCSRESAAAVKVYCAERSELDDRYSQAGRADLLVNHDGQEDHK